MGYFIFRIVRKPEAAVPRCSVEIKTNFKKFPVKYLRRSPVVGAHGGIEMENCLKMG